VPATRQHPCPVCGHKKLCGISPDGDTVNCRHGYGKAADDPAFILLGKKPEKGGEYYQYSRKPRRPEPEMPPGVRKRAKPAVLHEVYSAFLRRLSLALAHREGLAERGVGYEEMQRRGYRTLNNNRVGALVRLIDDGLGEHLPYVPGVCIGEKDGRKFWSLHGLAGIVFPVLDPKGRVAALLIRKDKVEDGNRYMYVSCVKRDGPSCGSPVHFPMFKGDRTTVRITEGVLKADVATVLGGVLTIGLPGVSGWPKVVKPLRKLGVKSVRLAFDADAPEKFNVATALKGLSEALRGEGFSVALERWDAADGKGIDDVLAAGKEPEVLEGDAAATAIEEIVTASAAATAAKGVAGEGVVDGGGGNSATERPEIDVSRTETLVNSEAADALGANPDNLPVEDLYRRGDVLVLVRKDDDGRPVIAPLPKELLSEQLEARATFKGRDKDNNTVPLRRPPKEVVEAVFARGLWEKVPRLEAVIDYPVMKPDGDILFVPGYDEGTALLLVGQEGALPVVPDEPTQADAVAAARTLLEVVADFPFVAEYHRSAWLAALLTLLARFAFNGPSPLFLVDANTRGSGKGLLMESAGLIVTGRSFPVTIYTATEDELRKRITAVAVSGSTFVLFDNVTGRFGNAVLDAAITSTIWEDRWLGHNKLVRAPLRPVWMATSNNASLGDDTGRRVCPIRLESKMEHPENRGNFRHPNLKRHVRKNRVVLVGAGLTILRAFHVAGRPLPPGLKPWGSFEEWSDLIRGAILWCGLADPREACVELQQRSDTTAANMAVLLKCWERMDPHGQGRTAAEAVEEVRYVLSEDSLDGWQREMRAAIEGLVGWGHDTAAKLGYRLRAKRRANYGGLFIDTLGEKHGTALWTVRRFGKACGGEGFVV
jgi:hypothetical protein